MIALALAPAPGRAQSPPPSPNGDIPELIAVMAVDGAPDDPTLREAFDRGLKLAFDEEVIRTEHLLPGAGYVLGLPLSNRFRQLFGDSAFGAWQVEITIVAPRRAESIQRDTPSRLALDVGFAIRDPQGKGGGAKPARWTLTTEELPPSAIAYAASLGRAVALLVLEDLHRRIDALRPADRVVVFDFDRRRSDKPGNAGGR